MGVIDMFLINHENIIKGFNAIRGVHQYLIVTDEKDRIICFSYDMDECVKLVEHYLKQEGLDRTIIKFERKSLKNKELDDIMDKKLVLLDKKLVLYEDIKKRALIDNIHGYTGKKPKYGVNIYKTIK